MEKRGIPTFSYDPAVVPVPDAGSYTCPVCSKRFDECVEVLVPAKAPWWRFQRNALGCPHCKTALQWVNQYPPNRGLQWFRSVVIGTLMGVLMSMANAGKAAIRFWWPGAVDTVAAVVFCIGGLALLLAVVTQDPHAKKPPFGHAGGRYVAASSSPALPQQFVAWWLIAMGWSTGLLLLPAGVGAYMWLLALIVGVLGVVVAAWWGWRARRKAVQHSA